MEPVYPTTGKPGVLFWVHTEAFIMPDEAATLISKLRQIKSEGPKLMTRLLGQTTGPTTDGPIFAVDPDAVIQGIQRYHWRRMKVTLQTYYDKHGLRAEACIIEGVL